MNKPYHLQSTSFVNVVSLHRYVQAMPTVMQRIKFWKDCLPGVPGWVLDQLANNSGVSIDGSGLIIAMPPDIVAKQSFPNTYRCKACGGENVQAAVWTNLNDPDLDAGDDFFVDDIFQPGGRGVYCPDCCADETGVYAPKTGPESGKYPADDEDDPDYNPVERFE